MASFNRIKVGQTLYTVTRQRMGNTTMTRIAVHTVLVKERQIGRWKVNRPKADPL